MEVQTLTLARELNTYSFNLYQCGILRIPNRPADGKCTKAPHKTGLLSFYSTLTIQSAIAKMAVMIAQTSAATSRKSAPSAQRISRQRFSALAQGGHLRHCSETSVFGGHADQLSWESSRPLLTRSGIRVRRSLPIATQYPHQAGVASISEPNQLVVRSRWKPSRP